MTKPKQGGPNYEVPTEWRRIVMEEDKDGRLRPVAVEDASMGESVHVPTDGGMTTSTQEPPPDMPQEWHDILQSSADHDAQISLVGDGQDAGEHTIPGMRIPQIYDDEMVSLDTNTGYSIGGEMSTPERTTVGAPPPPPPEYEEFPFAAAPDSSPELQAPRNPPLIVPSPQGEAFVPPPESMLPLEQGAAFGMPPSIAQALHTEELPLSTVEIDVPPGPDEESESTNELDAEYPAEEPLEGILGAEDLAPMEDHGAFDDEEDTGAFANLSIPVPEEAEEYEDPEPTSPAPAALAPALDLGVIEDFMAPMFSQFSEMMELQRETLSQFGQIQEDLGRVQEDLGRVQEDLGIQHEAQEEVHQKLDEIAAVCDQQSTTQEEQQQTLDKVSSAVAGDREEQKFHALHDLLQDLLLLYDFVDLRMRSLWEQHGKEHPSTVEMGAVRDRLIELLQRHELETIDINDPAFDPSSQRALQEILTSDPQEDGHISRIFRQGFQYRERVFRPSEVEVKRYPSS